MEAERFSEKKIVTDLDALGQSPGFVRLHGKDHQIKPIEVLEFFNFAEALARIKTLEAEKEVTLPQLVDGYYGLISPICPSIGKEDIRKCSMPQIAALMNMIQSHVTGGLTDEKKKTLGMRPLN